MNIQTETGRASLCGKLILVVDDDSEILKLLEKSLSSQGAFVVSATDVNSAVSVLEQVVPDLVVTDIRFEAKKRGFALLAYLFRSERLAGVPSLVISGSDSESSIDRALTLGAGAFMAKPFLPKALIGKAQTLINRSI